MRNAIDLARIIGVHAAARGDPRRGGDGQSAHAGDARCGSAVQDGRPRPDHRRPSSTARWPSTTPISIAAARIKGIVSPVAGQADILVVPDLESGNMLAKQLEFLGGAASAGIVLGARVPIILTSRADSRETRIASCAVAVLRRPALPSASAMTRPASSHPCPQCRLVEPEVRPVRCRPPQAAAAAALARHASRASAEPRRPMSTVCSRNRARSSSTRNARSMPRSNTSARSSEATSRPVACMPSRTASCMAAATTSSRRASTPACWPTCAA